MTRIQVITAKKIMYICIFPSRVRYCTWSRNAVRSRGLLSSDWKFSRAWKKCECNNTDTTTFLARRRASLAHLPHVPSIICEKTPHLLRKIRDTYLHMTTHCARSKMIRELFAARHTAWDMTMGQFRRRFPENRDIPEFLSIFKC